MKSVIMIFFVISALLFLFTLRYLLAWRKSGVYPPKQVVRKRAAAFAGGGGICLIFAVVLSYFF